MKAVTVFKSFNPVEAQLIRSLLDSAGLIATVAHETAALTTAAVMSVGGIQVQVPDEQAEGELEGELQSDLLEEQVHRLQFQEAAVREKNKALFRTVNQLRQSRARYEILFHNIALGVALLNPESQPR